ARRSSPDISFAFLLFTFYFCLLPYTSSAYDRADNAPRTRCRRRRAGVATPRLRAGIVPHYGRLLELRAVVFDHLDSDGRGDALWSWPDDGRPGGDGLGVAAGDAVHAACGYEHGRVGFGAADIGRDVPLVIAARRQRLGLVHGVVQHCR